MTENKNFKWLTKDIDSTLVLKVMNKEREVTGVFNVFDVLDITGDELEVITANIDDLTNFLTLGIVRFVNVSDSSDILDIPFRNLYKLYENANVLGEEKEEKIITFDELDTFSVIDGEVRNNFLVYSAVVDKVSDDLDIVMKIASEFGNYGMQEKHETLIKVTLINHRRLLFDDMDNK